MAKSYASSFFKNLVSQKNLLNVWATILIQFNGIYILMKLKKALYSIDIYIYIYIMYIYTHIYDNTHIHIHIWYSTLEDF